MLEHGAKLRYSSPDCVTKHPPPGAIDRGSICRDEPSFGRTCRANIHSYPGAPRVCWPYYGTLS